MPDKIKTPLAHALDTLVTQEDHQKVLRLLHALTQTCMSRSAVEVGKSDSEVAAGSRCYGSMMIEIEGMLHETPNPFVTPKQQSIPVAVAPAEFERLKKLHQSRNGTPPT